MVPTPVFDTARLREQLVNGLQALGAEYTLSPEGLDAMERYCSVLYETNEQMNLTRVPFEKAADLHFLDSLVVLPYLPKNDCWLLDVGTGGGFPGMPLAIARPGAKVTLVDATRKKVDFLKRVVDECGLPNVRCLQGRAEALGQDKQFREKFDCVVSRAVAALPVLYEWTVPFLRPGGVLIALKAEDVVDEVKNGAEILEKLGGGAAERVVVDIPGTEIKRSLVIVRKVRPTPREFPRAGGGR
jgi:16S rRNA (guanine527-N7)-methyltransferase